MELGQDPKQANVTPRRWRVRLMLLLVAIAVCGAAVVGWRRLHSADQVAAARVPRPEDAGNGGARGGRGGRGGGAVSVIVASAQRQDLPVYLDGLGSAQAFNTVTVKTRIDGQLNEVDFNEGQDVKKGDLLAKIDAQPYEVALSQAQAVLYRDQSQLADVKHNLDRDKQLVAQGVIAQQQYDTQNAMVGQLEGAVLADQAQVDNAKLQIKYCQITAPISGRVGLRMVDAGNMVRAADANGLMMITQVEPIAVLFSLPEDNLPAVVARMRSGTPISVRAMSRDSGTQLSLGKLLTIDDQIDQTTGTFRLKAVFDNPQRTLWPNQFVNARLLLDVKKNATVIPSAAVQTGAQGTFVYVVKDDSTVAIRPVTVGVAQSDIVSVEGVSAGERVVTDGQDRLRAGMQVDVQSDARAGSTPSTAVQTSTGRQRAASTGESQDATTKPQASREGYQRGQQNNRQQGRQGFRAAGGGAPPTGSQ